MERLFRTTSNLIGATLVIVLSDYFDNIISVRIMSLITAVFVSVIVMIIFEFITLTLPKRIPVLRRKFQVLAKFEGDWLQVIKAGNETMYSLVKFEYKSDKDDYIFGGKNYHSTLEDRVQFYSSNIVFEESISGFSYNVEGRMNSSGEFIKCWGYVGFEKDIISGKYTVGQGLFVDVGTDVITYKFNMHFIPKSTLKKHMEKSTCKKSLIDSLVKEFIG